MKLTVRDMLLHIVVVSSYITEEFVVHILCVGRDGLKRKYIVRRKLQLFPNQHIPMHIFNHHKYVLESLVVGWSCLVSVSQSGDTSQPRKFLAISMIVFPLFLVRQQDITFFTIRGDAIFLRDACAGQICISF